MKIASNPTIPFSSAPHMDKLKRKLLCFLLWCQFEVRTVQKFWPIWTQPPLILVPPFNHNKTLWQSPHPTLSQAIFRPASEPVLLFPKSLIVWFIMVFYHFLECVWHHKSWHSIKFCMKSLSRLCGVSSTMAFIIICQLSNNYFSPSLELFFRFTHTNLA